MEELDELCEFPKEDVDILHLLFRQPLVHLLLLLLMMAAAPPCLIVPKFEVVHIDILHHGVVAAGLEPVDHGGAGSSRVLQPGLTVQGQPDVVQEEV